ncbi:MAG: histidinol-phosphatase HisJ family protein [Oscillospiraceae bacterium]
MILSDFHTHSTFSTDGTDKLVEMANSAVEKGLKTICFTEHNDFDYPGGEFLLDTEAYRNELLRVREQLSGKIEVLFGVELGLMKHLGERLREYLDGRGFDFVIGSSHLIDGKDPYFPEYFAELGQKNGVLRYFESIVENIGAFSDFDVHGHLDYAVRYSPEKSYNPVDYREIIDEILRKIVSLGKGIEINTAGLRKGLSHANPHPFILKRYRELGGEIITVGSDAHNTADIAADFDLAESFLKDAGFEFYTVFRQRKPHFVKL